MHVLKNTSGKASEITTYICCTPTLTPHGQGSLALVENGVTAHIAGCLSLFASQYQTPNVLTTRGGLCDNA